MYASMNAELRVLHEKRLVRQRQRRWDAPELLELEGHRVRLCSLPSTHLGAQQWPSGLALAKHLARHAVAGRCLELGAGLGLVGLLAAKSAHVVLTDLEEMQELLRRTAVRACRWAIWMDFQWISWISNVPLAF